MQTRPFIIPLVFLGSLCIILAVAAGLILRNALSESRMARVVVAERDWLARERDHMLIQLSDLEEAYHQLSHEHELLKQEFEQEQNEIARLRAQLARGITARDKARYQSRIQELEELLEQYRAEMDVLVEDNQLLMMECQQMAATLNQISRQYQSLEEEKNTLEEQVDLARQLDISHARVTTYRHGRRLQESDRASRVDVIEVCFEVRENPIAEAGQRTVYYRLMGPGGNLIAEDVSRRFSFQQEQLSYTFQHRFVYQNQDKPVCTRWDGVEDFAPGSYQVIMHIGDKKFEPLFFDLR